jgi:hypothetical protein
VLPNPDPDEDTMNARAANAKRCAWSTIVLALLALASCRADDVLSVHGDNQSFTVPSGASFTITMGTVGPGSYESPPTISSPVVMFVDVVSGTPAIPSGATQDFRFRAVAVGQAIVGFHNTGSGKVVTDTVVVR